MKMKKLLAGVLSAAMVATMIPASMAFSSVSAAPENSLVASYDLTMEEGRVGWFARGAAASGIETGASGVVFDNGYQAENQSYTIANPLIGQASSGFSVAVDVVIPSGGYINGYESMFNFSGVDGDANSAGVFNVSGSGKGTHLNDWAGNYWDYPNDTAGIYDLTSESRFVLTVDADDVVTMYVNGSEVASIDVDTLTAIGSPRDIVAYVNGMAYFNLGAAPALWGQPAMTFSAVSFYNSALSESEVSALGDADAAMPTVTPTPEGEADITSGLISAYEFEGDLTNSVSGAGDATLVGYQLGTTTATSASFEDGAVALTPGTGTDAYGLKLDVDTSKISANTFTVSFNVAYAGLTDNAAGIFIGAANQDSQSWYSIGTLDDSDAENNAYFYRIWNNGGGMSYNQLLADQTSNLNEYANVTAVFDGTFATLYVNGVAVVSDEVSYVVKGDTGFYLGANCWDAVPDITVDSAYVYNRALSANDVEMLYAKNVADTLEVTAVGMQKGSIGENSRSTRFVARVNAAAVDQYNAQIACLGWAYNAGDTLESYSVIDLNTVTSSTEGGLNADDSTYAFTYVVQGNEETPATQMAVAPYVGVTVNGNTYYFCYDGKTGSYTVASKVVEAPSPFNHVSNTAA